MAEKYKESLRFQDSKDHLYVPVFQNNNIPNYKIFQKGRAQD